MAAAIQPWTPSTAYTRHAWEISLHTTPYSFWWARIRKKASPSRRTREGTSSVQLDLTCPLYPFLCGALDIHLQAHYTNALAAKPHRVSGSPGGIRSGILHRQVIIHKKTPRERCSPDLPGKPLAFFSCAFPIAGIKARPF